MVEINRKIMGILLSIFSIILIIILIFVKVNFDSQAIFLCEAVNLNPDLTMAQCPAHTSNIPWLLLLAFGVSSVILASGIYLFFTGKSQTKQVDSGKEVKIKKDYSNLNEEEKQICSLIERSNGSIYQSEIVEKTELSKVKITRILDHLEHDLELIERKRRGMTNIVVLK